MKNKGFTLIELLVVVRRLHLKRIPSFTFEYDNTPEQAARVESIFQVIEKEKHDPTN